MIFEKLFSKENKKDEIVDVKLSDKKFNELRIKLSIGDVTVEQDTTYRLFAQKMVNYDLSKK